MLGDFLRRARAHDEMSPGQAAVLGHLARSGPLSIADLARLEQTLTASGGDALASARRARAAGIARAIREDLDDAEREIIRRIPEVLRKLQP